MKPAFLVRGLGAAALVLSLAACGGGGSGSDTGASGATASSDPALAARKPDGSTADVPKADESSSASSLSWAP